ncbi:hypothetical protein MBM_01004 [Drepanopeziza brunnea f. sp. 'multigermtubi' MB_m1]|uniref:Uncharacterized protein n=1 Tax=Marssonina brunnea f. sp. multigermtubi (strain MB_m1) TaxID=1072389 RepID=K1X5D6_MARBU|nr:uncharacterized protein MBM_01004 [Drepanopeziza brunnea f. sp. 'multigermtubi' MB_m1]EKD20322.1 hypothetical protein MBM_01004 [Drepanopeziza brunnea f. sp. 'multigermtubi' MB_m1]
MCTQQITTHAPCGHHTRPKPRYCRYRFNIGHLISCIMVRSEAQCSKRKCPFQTGEGEGTKGVAEAQGAAGLRRTSSVLSELSLVEVEMQGESEWRKKLRGRVKKEKKEREKERDDEEGERKGEGEDEGAWLGLEAKKGRAVVGLEAAGRSAGKGETKGDGVVRLDLQVGEEAREKTE